ncbi:MAG: serine/threonine-protein phosphatase [Clostridia bacterium]|nr:serine/threonine-protein phosphatase [Clostridia bacterium]
MNNIKFRMVAYTGAAGKYDPQAPMSGNEDNFYVDDNLSDNIPSHCSADDIIDMNECGCIMAVCDGMGGMNAGEVASAIAVQTIQDYFAPNNVSKDIAISAKEREKYLENVVVEADKRIKEDAKNNAEHNGMGSTIILAWIVGNELTVTWCGDSRAYRFNPDLGLELLSEDHSYVQDLVKKGLITYDDTFDHPQGNIITRSLGDPSKKAKPETRHFFVNKDDIILLCSDGLSGVLRDRKTKDSEGNYYEGDNIEDIIRNNSSTMSDCKNALWKAAEAADWYDNVTILLCQIVDGPVQKDDVASRTIDSYQKDTHITKSNVETKEINNNSNETDKSFWNDTMHFQVKLKPKFIVFSILGIICIGLGFILLNKFTSNETELFKQEQSVLLNKIKEKTDFMQASGLTIDSLYFDEIKKQISSINDSTSLNKMNQIVSDYINNLDIKTKILTIINEAINKHNNNPKITNDLRHLRDECLHNNLSLEEIDKKIKEIEKKNKLGADNTNKKQNKTNTDHTELTPIHDTDTLRVPFKMLPHPNSIEQINNLKKQYINEGYSFIGIYLDGKVVSPEKYAAGKKYHMCFKKTN